MTEAAAAFNEIQKERSGLKNSSHHRKGGSAVSKLGNRRMTNKEIEEKHGECKTYDCGDLTMTFAQFREMPNDLQVEFLNKLQDKYDISVKHIGRELFGLRDDDVLRSHLQLRKNWDLCNPNKARAKTGLLQFREDIAEAKKRAELAKIIDIQSVMPDPESIPKFMTWEEFKVLSGEEKVIFVNRLLDEYGVGMSRISTALFGKGTTDLRKHLVDRGLLNRIHVRSMTGSGRTDRGNWQQFQADINAWTESEREPVLTVVNEDNVPLFMDWEQVLKLTNAELIIFYNRLLDNYGVGMKTIDKELFGISYNKTRSFLVRRGVFDQIHSSESGTLPAWSMEYAQKTKRFRDDISEWRGEGNATVEEPESKVIVETPVEPLIEESKNETTADIDEEFYSTLPSSTWQLITDPEPKEDPMEYHDSSFTSSYISKGLNLDEFHALALLFDGKKVKVEIRITEL